MLLWRDEVVYFQKWSPLPPVPSLFKTSFPLSNSEGMLFPGENSVFWTLPPLGISLFLSGAIQFVPATHNCMWHCSVCPSIVCWLYTILLRDKVTKTCLPVYFKIWDWFSTTTLQPWSWKKGYGSFFLRFAKFPGCYRGEGSSFSTMLWIAAGLLSEHISLCQ